MRLSRSVLDSTADLTFDPVSWSFSTGTQPRSVMLQNQKNKARRYGNESRQPVYEEQIHTQVSNSGVRTFTQAWGGARVQSNQYPHADLIMGANYARSASQMLV